MPEKISIVMPTFNQGAFIGEALQSVADQHDPVVELIVMDGGSTDNTVEVIKRYESIITYWQSEKDGGQSAAINAGFRRATGRFKVWLNSDDILLPGALQNLRKMIRKYPDCRWFAGSTLWIDKIGTVILAGKQENPSRILFRTRKPVQASPSSFMRDDLLEEFGLLKEDMHYTMDTELWYRFVNGGEMLRRIPGYTWALRIHEGAKTSGHNFASSPLSDPNHPGAIRLHQEQEMLRRIAPGHDFKSTVFFYLNKIFDRSFISRLTDKRMLGHNFREFF